MNDAYIMLNLASLLISSLYWYMVLAKKDPIYRIMICVVSVVTWYTTAQAVIRVDTLGVAISLLYDLFMIIQILSGFREVWDLWRDKKMDWWG